MPTPLIPQEIYLLERYTSLDYFAEMRDAWAAMVQAGEDALEAFMRQLPPDYRSRPLWNQPDIVWGERVLPNLRNTLVGLDNGVIHLSHGEWRALQYAGNINSACAGMWRDHSADWMPETFLNVFSDQQRIASTNASNISFTVLSGWIRGALSERYKEMNRGPLNPPASWPIYRLNPHVRVRTGQPVPQNGIYLPDADDCSAQALVKGYDAPEANVGRNPVTTQRLRTEPTTWTLVERIADEGGGTPGKQTSAHQHTHACAAKVGSPARKRADGTPLHKTTAAVTSKLASSCRWLKAAATVKPIGFGIPTRKRPSCKDCLIFNVRNRCRVNHCETCTCCSQFFYLLSYLHRPLPKPTVHPTE